MSEIRFSTLYYHAKKHLSTFWEIMRRFLMAFLEVFDLKNIQIGDRVIACPTKTKNLKRFSIHRRQNSGQNSEEFIIRRSDISKLEKRRWLSSASEVMSFCC